MRIHAITWNLFHGRDKPPDQSLFTWRSRLLKLTEVGDEYAQVNRSLFAEFATALSSLRWDVALLQEAPPRWAAPFAEALGVETHRVLTSRNWLPPLQGALADFNPDLIASSDGGSNLTLFRGALQPPGTDPAIVERLDFVVHEGRPERRMMAFTRTAAGLCVANLHATNDRPELAGPEVLRAAGVAVDWAGDAPLIFGGDLNLRPAEHPDVFEQLRARHGLAPPTTPHRIDHLLSRGLELLELPADLPHPEVVRSEDFRGPLGLWRREAGHRLRLSDHEPVGAEYELEADPAR